MYNNIKNRMEFTPPPSIRFYALSKKNSDDPLYVNLLDFIQLFVADAPMKNKNPKSFSEHFWDTQYNNDLDFSSFYKENLHTNPG